MRYAVFSDIHANLEAYDAVLEALHGENPDKHYCAGDIVGYGADPSACISRTKQLNPTIVAGNHDWGAVGLTNISDFTENAKAAVIWTAGSLGESEKNYLRGLGLLHKDGFTVVHGSLNRPEDFEYIFGLGSAYPTFLMMEDEKPVCFVGHTHVAGVFVKGKNGDISYNAWPEVKIEKDKRYIVNVGSVGQPRDTDPRAAYCIYDTERQAVEIKRVKYNVAKAQEKIIKAGLPKMLAERLSLGK